MPVFKIPLHKHFHKILTGPGINMFCVHRGILENVGFVKDIVRFWGCASGPQQARAGVYLVLLMCNNVLKV